jgi:hypothetical protein
MCAQKVWEALLTAFPLDHERMQTVLLAREIARMMRWDGDSKGAVNSHFASVTELHRTMGYIGNLSIEDVLKSVLMATLKASTNRSLRDAYHKVLDDLDDDKDLSFALIQDDCARQFRRHPDERHPSAWSSHHPGTQRHNQGPHGATRTTLNKTRPQPGDGVSAFLCNFLDYHGVKPVKVLKKAGLRHETQFESLKLIGTVVMWYTHCTWPLNDSCPKHFILIVRLPLTMMLLTSSPLSLSYNADPVFRYSWFASGSSWGYLALPQFSKPDSDLQHVRVHTPRPSPRGCHRCWL